MIPTYFLELKDSSIAKDVYKKYFDNQYPNTSDCSVLKQQIPKIQNDIAEIKKRQSSGYKECNCSPTISSSTGGVSGWSITGGFTGSNIIPNPDYSLGFALRNKSLSYLNSLLNLKLNLIKSANCDAQIIAQEQAAATEAQVQQLQLAQAAQYRNSLKNKRTYLFVGIGLAIVTTIGIIIYKKKKP